MTVVDNKIVMATEDELFRLWLDRGIDDVMSFYDYLDRMKSAGVSITENQ